MGIAIQSDGLCSWPQNGSEVGKQGPGRPGPGSDLGVMVEQKVQAGGLVGRLGQQDQD